MIVKNGEIYIVLPKIKGIGPVKEQLLKILLLESAKEAFLKCIENDEKKVIVYHRDFTKK